jgi:hypothetical protein
MRGSGPVDSRLTNSLIRAIHSVLFAAHSPPPPPPSHYAGHWVVQSVAPMYWPHITHLGWALIGAGFGAHYYDGPISTIVRLTEGSLSVFGPWSGHIGVCRNECLPTRNPRIKKCLRAVGVSNRADLFTGGHIEVSTMVCRQALLRNC